MFTVAVLVVSVVVVFVVVDVATLLLSTLTQAPNAEVCPSRLATQPSIPKHWEIAVKSKMLPFSVKGHLVI